MIGLAKLLIDKIVVSLTENFIMMRLFQENMFISVYLSIENYKTFLLLMCGFGKSNFIKLISFICSRISKYKYCVVYNINSLV